MVLDIPANNKAMAKILAALFPNRGCNIACAWDSSSTCCPWEKKAVAAKSIIAELIAHPTIIENRVSMNSYFNMCWMRSSPFKWISRLWTISEWRKRLWGMTTAPNTLIIIKSEPWGTVGTKAPSIADGQWMSTKKSS